MEAAKFLRAILCPNIIARHIIRKLSIGSLEFRLSLQALERGAYAFGIRQAIYLASKLKHPRVSVLEFGVGEGDGLKTMELYAADLGKKYGIGVEIYGFDLGSGLPAPSDYRDLPYIWKQGDYRMDVERVRSELKTAKLFLGDVGETISEFGRANPAPIGFISFDLDYYSSTVSAFRVFDFGDERFLPRVVCYFDDISSDGRALYCEYVGEELAIQEFNRRQGRDDKLSPAKVQQPMVEFSASWLDQTWIYHRFLHPEYNQYISYERLRHPPD
jgi:hypothetical protein